MGKWLRSLELYLASEDITNIVKKRNKLLHLGGSQLQEVAYNLPGALEIFDKDINNDVFKTLVEKLTDYFSPKQNSTFERHIFRNIKPEQNENFSKFVLKIRNQASKCSFGNSAQESNEINIKDKIIDSWAPIDLKKKLLEKERSLDEVLNLCQIHEQIGSQSKAMDLADTGPSTSFGVNKIEPFNNDRGTHCTRCGKRNHSVPSKECPAKNSKCNKCGFVGHYAFLCRTDLQRKRFSSNRNSSHEPQNKRRRASSRVNRIEEEETEMEGTVGIRNFQCFKVSGICPEDQNDDLIECNIGGVPITVLIDSGSKVNIINGGDWESLKKMEAVTWDINPQSQHSLRGYAAGEPLDVSHTFETTVSLQGKHEIITNFYVVEQGDISILGKDVAKRLGILKLGLNINHIEEIKSFPKIKNIKVKLTINSQIKPVKQPVRRVPITLEAKVERKLKEALLSDIIEKVTEPSAWISPIVVVLKPNDDIRICVDMRRANEAILRENYPIPTFDSFMTKLRGAKFFSRLDLANAYHQLELDEESRPITTFITHKEKEHDYCLNNVLEVFKVNNVLLNEEKCIKKVKELYFLGHKLSDKGIEADHAKIKTILQFRPPTTKEETRSFLGLVTYLGKFIPDLGTTTEPLRRLIRENQKFEWCQVQQESFNKLKKSLATLPILSYFDPQLRTRLVADASPVALGAVLLQFNEQRTPQVISFASKSLSATEKRYSQTEKESLALVWAVERFHYYLAGLEFELVTDHKPLEAIFKPSSKPPARIERWVLRLQAYKFRVIYQSGKLNIADSLSRLCQLDEEPSFDKENEYHVRALLEIDSPAAMNISKIITEVLQLAHEGHPGETVMKRRLRAKVWWPFMDREVEKFVKNCRGCLLVTIPDKPPPMKRHKFPEGPWQCVAIDLMGPLPNQDQLLVIIDYYSRYQEIKFLRTTTSAVIINHLSEIFCRLGIPRSIRADNGPQFASQEFKNYCSHNNIELIHTPPYWPQANGEVENMNRAILKRLQIAQANKQNFKTELQKFTMMYNVTPHGTTGKSPSELMFNRTIRDKIPSMADLVVEPVDEEARDNDMVNKQKGKEMEDSSRRAKIIEIKQGDKVLAKNMIIPNKLIPRFNNEEFTVVERKGNEVTLSSEDGQIVKRHVSHLKKLPEPIQGCDETDISRNKPDLRSESPNPITHPLSPKLINESEPEKEISKVSGKLPLLKLKKMEGMWHCTS
ncbi:uncharacterized protein K02A2.6-like [Coccinella septempunctata]|uniref:uncharacterized protein K02A2.6-like n=1 Tax=Coccinella septempunctata TaxID=41139 RepID=UPI001D0900EA|nr:uncharacterized protein K02A2.6-like [Coccinella septempunctata]